MGWCWLGSRRQQRWWGEARRGATNCGGWALGDTEFDHETKPTRPPDSSSQATRHQRLRSLGHPTTCGVTGVGIPWDVLPDPHGAGLDSNWFPPSRGGIVGSRRRQVPGGATSRVEVLVDDGFNLQHKHVFRPGEQLDRGLWEPGWIGDRAWIWDGRHVGRHGPTRGSAQQDPMFLVSAQRSKSTWPGAPGTLATWNLQGGVRGAPRCVGCWESFWSSPPTNVGASIGFVEGNIFFAQSL